MRINTRELLMLLAEKALTKTELAKRSGISRQNLSAILARCTCEPVTAGKIAKGLGVDLCEILMEE